MSALPIPSMPTLPERLTDSERSELRVLEAEGRQLRRAWERFPQIMLTIRDKRLYREGHPSFEEYLRVRWGITRGRGYQIIGAGEVVAVLSAPGDDLPATIPLPSRERVTRPMQGLPAPVQRAIWKDTVQTAGDDPTEADVAAAVVRVAPEFVKVPKPRTPAKDAVERARIAGVIPAGVEVTVTEPDADDEPEPELPAELTDAEWLETLPPRGKLAGVLLKRFDAEALLVRSARKFMDSFRHQIAPLRKAAQKASGGHIGPWQTKYTRFIKLDDPAKWQACDGCGGTGQVPLIGKCAACKGEGFHV